MYQLNILEINYLCNTILNNYLHNPIKYDDQTKRSIIFDEEEYQHFIIDVKFILQFHKTFNITE